MILIIDFGSQTAHLIGRRLRQIGVEYDYILPEEAEEKIEELSPKGIILSGGPTSIYLPDAPRIDKKIFEKDIPILGICYGLQLTAHVLEGGEVKTARKEFGPEDIHVIKENNLLPKGKDGFNAIMSHGDSVTEIPDGFERIASTENVANAAIQNTEKKIYGIQFHPEAKHTEYGMEILTNFVINICGEKADPIELKPQELISQLKEKIGDEKVLFAVSGGVDSSVGAFLVGKAIGKNLIPVYVESGLMRVGTVERVKKIFTELIHADLIVVEAQKRFMDALKGIEDPEEKRKTIGKLYIDIFDEEATKHGDVKFLGQGTIYSDVIESKGSKNASNIKSHHNVGGLPKDMKFMLIEPMRHFYKDEVRELGRKAGLPEDVVMEQPFPGPGYAVKIRGEVTAKRLEQEKQADGIVIEEMKKSGWYEKVFQCFAIMTGAYSTAVKGDDRSFSEVVALRAYESDDVMTSRWAQLPYDLLQKISSRIVNEVPDVSRVVYDITTKPPATMEWE
ncbi:MAG TPA: glutamine-hydrolyzing GMP synthase [Candidatus Dojkabacteria bacterium]|jgi:GMP synthase (glutamine-hydrolysing)